MALAATAVDASNVKVSDENAYLSRNVTIEANNKIVRKPSEFGSWEERATANSGQKKKSA